MNPLVNLYESAANFVLKNTPLTRLRIEMAKRQQNATSSQLEREAVSMQAQSLAEWRSAVAMATDPLEPERTALQRLYDNLLLDNHLSSVIDSRILFCQRSPFKIVNEKGEENMELSWLFERTWFEEFIAYVLWSRFMGNTLIELFEPSASLELAQVTRIPMAHFKPKKGIIVRMPSDNEGWAYKEGALQNYYIQVGKDDDLGMLAQLAPIVLAKKLGLGSWLDYVEKYGVPPLFITTDREDDNRLNQLFEAASNFRSNSFMIGRGNEKFEVGKDGSGGNADNFDKLIERANSEISKRVLGGSGLTDERAYVGAVEIQYKLAKDRFDSDKLLIKNIINQELFPRLIKFSPVYAPLQNHYFDWDNTENHTVKEFADIVDVLSRNYELDPKQIEEKTGIKILGKKSSGLMPGNNEGFEASLKKKSLNTSAPSFMP